MKYKILIVDDEPANLRVLGKLFRRDFDVLAASSGAEALQLLEQHDVALLITDQCMPQMTGIELLKITADLRPHMVRIILTGYTDVASLVEAINCGQVYKYVTKPWDNRELQLTVSRAIEHFQANKKKHELGLVNQRLTATLNTMRAAILRAVQPHEHETANHAGETVQPVGSASSIATARADKLNPPVFRPPSIPAEHLTPAS